MSDAGESERPEYTGLLWSALAGQLMEIEECDDRGDYETRYRLVLDTLNCAHALGLDCGIGIDPEGDEGFEIVVYIDLPQGQVSWHMPRWQGGFDGHTTAMKYARIRQFAREVDLGVQRGIEAAKDHGDE